MHKKSNSEASKLFEHRQTVKHYLALGWGHDQRVGETFVVDEPIRPRENDFRMEMGDGGVVCKTLVKPLLCTHLKKEWGSAPVTLYLLRPISGRRHQLRLHLMHVGHPIVGDATYSTRTVEVEGKERILPRMFLHAWRLTLPMEKVMPKVDVEAPEGFSEFLVDPVPKDIENLAVPEATPLRVDPFKSG